MFQKYQATHDLDFQIEQNSFNKWSWMSENSSAVFESLLMHQFKLLEKNGINIRNLPEW